MTDLGMPPTEAKIIVVEVTGKQARSASRVGAVEDAGLWGDRRAGGTFGDVVVERANRYGWSLVDRVRVVAPVSEQGDGAEVFCPEGWFYTDDPRVLELVGGDASKIEVRGIVDWQMRFVAGLPQDKLLSVSEGFVPSWLFVPVNSPGRIHLVPAGGTPVPLDRMDFAEAMTAPYEKFLLGEMYRRSGAAWSTPSFDVAYQAVAWAFEHDLVEGRTVQDVLQLALRVTRAPGRPLDEQDCHHGAEMSLQGVAGLARYLADMETAVAGIALGGYFGEVLREIFMKSRFPEFFGKGSARRAAMNRWLAKQNTALEQALREPLD